MTSRTIRMEKTVGLVPAGSILLIAFGLSLWFPGQSGGPARPVLAVLPACWSPKATGAGLNADLDQLERPRFRRILTAQLPLPAAWCSAISVCVSTGRSFRCRNSVCRNCGGKPTAGLVIEPEPGTAKKPRKAPEPRKSVKPDNRPPPEISDRALTAEKGKSWQRQTG